MSPSMPLPIGHRAAAIRDRAARCALLALLALASGAVPLAAQHFPDEGRLLEIIRTRVDEGRATGIVLGVLEADGTRRIVAYGDPGPGAAPLGAESVFEIGSITKAFTGIMLADMAARGEVGLEAPARTYAHPGVTIPSRGGREITLLDLATHRSGLPRLPSNFAPADPLDPYVDYSVDRLHAFLSSHELERDPGAEYEYSNLGMGLLGHLLAARAGTDYGSLVRERILEPLGMSMSGIALDADMRARLAVGHDAAGEPTRNWNIPTLAGAGALRSNTNDMLAFLEANLGSPGSDLERAMRASHEPRREAGPDMDVGLGWHVRSVGMDRIVWHNGGTGGYRTFAGFDPDRGVGAVVLTNSARGADDIGFHLLNPSLELERPRERVDVPRETLERYVGLYRLTDDFAIEVTLAAAGLRIQATDQPAFPIFASSETEFFLEVVNAQVTFVVEEGEVTALILHQGGADRRARKVR